jgi:hypothetical protein
VKKLSVHLMKHAESNRVCHVTKAGAQVSRQRGSVTKNRRRAMKMPRVTV